jgi:hypothetical protein
MWPILLLVGYPYLARLSPDLEKHVNQIYDLEKVPVGSGDLPLALSHSRQ